MILGTLDSWAYLLFLVFVIALIVAVIVSLINTQRTKIMAQKEERYRQLSAEAASLKKEIEKVQQKLTEEIDEIKRRTATVEKILQEVE